jgi:hypothetical protein
MIRAIALIQFRARALALARALARYISRIFPLFVHFLLKRLCHSKFVISGKGKGRGKELGTTVSPLF